MVATASFETVTPANCDGAFQMPKPPSNFSLRVNATPMGGTFDSLGFLVKGVYGDGTTQDELRKIWLQQAEEAGDNPKLISEKLLMYGIPLCEEQAEALSEWEAAWEEEATNHIKSTTVGKKGAKLKYSPILRDDRSFKINVPNEVALQCASEAGVDNVFAVGGARYQCDVVAKVSGMWRNSTNYGLSLSALRIRRGKVVSKTGKRKVPTDFEFTENKWSRDGSDEE